MSNTKMIQNGLLLSLGLMMSQTTSAYSPNPFTGYYANLSVGAIQNAATITASGNSSFFRLNTGPGNHLDSSQEERVWENSLMTALSFGYGGFLEGDWHDLHLNGEIFVNLSKRRNASLDNFAHSESHLDKESLSTKTRAKLHNLEYGLDLLPGFLFDSHSLLYARIGMAINELTLNSSSLFSFTDLAINPGAIDDSTVNMSEEHNKIALRLGLGIEHEICPKLSVTADYIYTFYGHANAHGVTDLVALPSVPIAHIRKGLFGDTSVQFQAQMLMMGIKYYL